MKQKIGPILLVCLAVIVIILGIKLYFFPRVETVEIEKLTEQEQTLEYIEQLNILKIGTEIIGKRIDKEKSELYSKLDESGSATDRSKNPRKYLVVSCGDSYNLEDCENVEHNEPNSEAFGKRLFSTGADYDIVATGDEISTIEE